jgi:hypothetical protein
MARGANNKLDRLLPRHDSETGVDLAWNVRVTRTKLLKKEETFSRAKILDLSLEGALVEAPDTQKHEVGSRVDVRFREIDGFAHIRHRRPGNPGFVSYGVKFAGPPDFVTAINAVVGEVRGNSAALEQAWEKQN